VVRSGTAAPPARAAWLLGAAAAILAITAAALLFWPGTSHLAGTGGLRLELWDHSRGEAVHSRAAEPGEAFQLRHVHSVTRRPVVETFSVTTDGVAMEELWFDEFGANLPAGPERIGDVTTTFLSEAGGFRVLHHGRLLPTVPLRVGSPPVNHVLTFSDGTRLRLLDVAEPWTYLEIRVVGG
jgi:hypothetical protein